MNRKNLYLSVLVALCLVGRFSYVLSVPIYFEGIFMHLPVLWVICLVGRFVYALKVPFCFGNICLCHLCHIWRSFDFWQSARGFRMNAYIVWWYCALRESEFGYYPPPSILGSYFSWVIKWARRFLEGFVAIWSNSG